MKKFLIFFFAVLVLFGISRIASADFINGGFETGDLNHWTFNGNVEVLTGDSLPYGWQDTDEYGEPINCAGCDRGYFIEDPSTSFSPFEGDYMVKIGSQSADENWYYNNYIYQSFTENYYLPQLTFAFNMWSYDYSPYDLFIVGVNDPLNPANVIWEIGADYVNTAGEPPTLDYSGWVVLNIDLVPYLGENASDFVIWFAAGETLDTCIRTRTGVYLDNIQLSSAPVPEPTTILLLGSGLVGLAGFRRKFKK